MTFPNSYPILNPVDLYREHLSEAIASIVGLEPTAVYPKLQWTQALDKGDLMLPVPALQLKGRKPQELAAEIADKFPESPLVEKPKVTGTFVSFYFKALPLSKNVIGSVLSNKPSMGQIANLG